MESSGAEREEKHGIVPGSDVRVWETGQLADSTALSLVNCPALQMSPEDTATIIIQADTQSDYTFWLAWWPWLSLKQKQLRGGAVCRSWARLSEKKKLCAVTSCSTMAAMKWQHFQPCLSNRPQNTSSFVVGQLGKSH